MYLACAQTWPLWPLALLLYDLFPLSLCRHCSNVHVGDASCGKSSRYNHPRCNTTFQRLPSSGVMIISGYTSLSFTISVLISILSNPLPVGFSEKFASIDFSRFPGVGEIQLSILDWPSNESVNNGSSCYPFTILTTETGMIYLRASGQLVQSCWQESV